MQQYDRPVYVYRGGNPDIDDSDALFLVYSGSRWFGLYQPQGKMLEQDESLRKIFEGAMTNYHGESLRLYQPVSTHMSRNYSTVDTLILPLSLQLSGTELFNKVLLWLVTQRPMAYL